MRNLLRYKKFMQQRWERFGNKKAIFVYYSQSLAFIDIRYPLQENIISILRRFPQ